MSDPRVQNFARILVDYSTKVKPGERVAVTTSLAAEPLARELYALILERGAYPHILFDLPGQDELFYAHAPDDMLDVVPIFHKIAFEDFDVLIKVPAETNTRSLSNVDMARMSRRRKGLAALLQAQMRRGAEGTLRWMSTQFPTPAYAMEAEMGFEEYQDFFYNAVHADLATPDPVAFWQDVQQQQQRMIDRFKDHSLVELRGPNVDLHVSVKGRKFDNACGHQNMPDGEIYTGPIEDSANGWVRFTYPAIFGGRIVEGVELTFKDGQVVKATAEKNQAFLASTLDTDYGSRYIGEFAIGTNFEINRFTKNILFDEKIGGSFHIALGAGYPETGSRNRSLIHWDMICDLRKDSEILLDGEVIYRNGQFIF